MDESGTHDPSPVTIMAGAYGTAAQWKDVEARIKELENKRQFSIFNSKDLKSGHGSFKDWSSEQRLELVQDVIAILVAKLVEAGFVIQIENTDYDKYYSSGDGPTSAVLEADRK